MTQLAAVTQPRRQVPDLHCSSPCLAGVIGDGDGSGICGPGCTPLDGNALDLHGLHGVHDDIEHFQCEVAQRRFFTGVPRRQAGVYFALADSVANNKSRTVVGTNEDFGFGFNVEFGWKIQVRFVGAVLAGA